MKLMVLHSKKYQVKKLKQHIINIPNSEDTSKFNEITKPIFKQLRKLEEENEKLLAIKKRAVRKVFLTSKLSFI